MNGFTAQYGRARYGRTEYGRGIDRIPGNPVSGSFQADGQCTVTFNGRMIVLGRFQADGQCVVLWTGALHLFCSFEADGQCTVVWISASGAVDVTCIVADGSGENTGATDFSGGLVDVPFSY